MNLKDILKKVDHTLLSPVSSWDDIKELIKDAKKYETASVCIAPSFVKKAREFDDDIKICTVIGFPLGYQTTETKVFETKDAIKNGADEIDMVINIGRVGEDYEYILNEIIAIKKVCEDKILKVIIETAYLSEKEKMELCDIVSKSGADYIKTSTGFAESGAKLEDIILFKDHLNSRVKIKAAGGISSVKDAEDFINAGAERLGTSRLVKIAKGIENESGY
ncbi:MAG: deoxyribose-phosphate aldolase [Tissierellia bacterium]|nr:deoxyribose-phosphate aldolase [Tissierellia bacterium]